MPRPSTSQCYAARLTTARENDRLFLMHRNRLEWEGDVLQWEGEGKDNKGDYILVDVLPTHVLVMFGKRGGDGVRIPLVLVRNILKTLTDHGLHVWNPQQECWMDWLARLGPND